MTSCIQHPNQENTFTWHPIRTPLLPAAPQPIQTYFSRAAFISHHERWPSRQERHQFSKHSVAINLNTASSTSRLSSSSQQRRLRVLQSASLLTSADSSARFGQPDVSHRFGEPRRQAFKPGAPPVARRRTPGKKKDIKLVDYTWKPKGTTKQFTQKVMKYGTAHVSTHLSKDMPMAIGFV